MVENQILIQIKILVFHSKWSINLEITKVMFSFRLINIKNKINL